MVKLVEFLLFGFIFCLKFAFIITLEVKLHAKYKMLSNMLIKVCYF